MPFKNIIQTYETNSLNLLILLLQIEVSCILGGINCVKRKFPHLAPSRKIRRKTNLNGDTKQIDGKSGYITDKYNNSNTNIRSKYSMKNNSTQSKESSISRSGSSSSTIPAGRSRPCSVQHEKNEQSYIIPNDQNSPLPQYKDEVTIRCFPYIYALEQFSMIINQSSFCICSLVIKLILIEIIHRNTQNLPSFLLPSHGCQHWFIEMEFFLVEQSKQRILEFIKSLD